MNGCAWARNALGVYVLGAIDPAERSRVEAHLAECPACRDEVAALAALPALLGRVDERQIEEMAGPPPELLESLLAEAAAEERRRRRALPWIPLAVAACVLLVVGALFGGFVLQGGQREAALPSTTAAPPTATVSPGPTGDGHGQPRPERVAASNPRTGVRGYALLHRKRSGTAVELYLSGAPVGENCRFRVVARNGQDDVLGSWYVAQKGTGEYYGYTRFPRETLYSLEISTLDGRPLLMIPA
ncbi:zf-HC2 domain-containing protein [Actinomadura kijaniata]|uniref:zf-HC2 domain-containing protein n=1 Tax=Actinomadura kijaniata TaxID=46161 RepID=UPI0008350E07|nr:zf-HC2 domain-containing protein [Actinomadura kijaniata]